MVLLTSRNGLDKLDKNSQKKINYILKLIKDELMRLSSSKFRYSCLYLAMMFYLTLQSCSSPNWIELFDGKSLQNWKASENTDSWKVENEMIVTRGSRSHLFYNGDVEKNNFKNFELIVDVKTESGSNSGIYFHTEYQDEGWPAKGYECQIFNNLVPYVGEGYIERKMTGSLYGVRNTWIAPMRDNEWFNYRIIVQGKTIRTYINGELISDYTEPDSLFRPEGTEGRYLSSGTFALQCHDPNSVVFFKNIRVRALPNDIQSVGEPLLDMKLEKRIVQHSTNNFPLMDLHVHLKGGLTLETALANARKYGLNYGIAVNCGLKMGYETEKDLREFLDNYKKPANTYLAMQAEGREWTDIFSDEIIAEFDYVFTDAMTWTNKNGKRMRLWIKEETEVGNADDFMEQLVDNIEKIIQNEPVDIYVNATYLPKEISDRYDELWTNERMDRVINVLVKNNVALEIGSRYLLPSSTFIKRAKQAGVKFTFGTNNNNPDNLGHLENCLNMIDECNLEVADLWIPNK